MWDLTLFRTMGAPEAPPPASSLKGGRGPVGAQEGATTMLSLVEDELLGCWCWQSLFLLEFFDVGSSSEADYHMRNSAMDDSIGGS